MAKVNILAGRHKLLLSTVKRRKLSWFGHVGRHDMLPKIILQGTVDCSRRRGNPRKSLTSKNGQASLCRHCCASQTIEKSTGIHHSGDISRSIQRPVRCAAITTSTGQFILCCCPSMIYDVFPCDDCLPASRMGTVACNTRGLQCAVFYFIGPPML